MSQSITTQAMENLLAGDKVSWTISFPATGDDEATAMLACKQVFESTLLNHRARIRVLKYLLDVSQDEIKREEGIAKAMQFPQGIYQPPPFTVQAPPQVDPKMPFGEWVTTGGAVAQPQSTSPGFPPQVFGKT